MKALKANAEDAKADVKANVDRIMTEIKVVKNDVRSLIEEKKSITVHRKTQPPKWSIISASMMLGTSPVLQSTFVLSWPVGEHRAFSVCSQCNDL